jgi:aminoglycoside 6'-N-acetyltransferase
MQAADLPLVQNWLAAPHVAYWWGDAAEQFALISADLDEPGMDQFIVTKDDQPFGYLQCYDPDAWPENGFGDYPRGTRGIDQFIGEPDMVGCGHGSLFIRAFVDSLLAHGTPCVVTDPDAKNTRAIRAYEKAGFRKNRLVDTPAGPALLMVRKV